MTLSIVTAFTTLIGDSSANYAMFSSADRNIGGIYPHVTLEETGRDELFITQHPVDVGCPVSDHAFIQPYTVEIKYGFSDSTEKSEGYSKTVYETFQTLQQSGKTFSVTTGKRSYTNMLARYMVQRTNPQSENSLDISLICQYLVITSTMGDSSSSSSSSSPSAGTDKAGQQSSPTNVGSVALDPTSVASKGYGMVIPVNSSNVSISP